MMGEFRLIEPPEKSNWRCHLAGIIYEPDKGYAPNWFHRKMQRLLFGALWIKRTPTEETDK